MLVVLFVLQPELWPPDNPLLLGRNVTIAAANFSEAAGNYAHLHLGFMEARVVILQNVTVTLRNLALGRARKNSGQGIPFFAGEGTSSVLLLINVLRLRLACAPNAEELVAALRSTPRAPPGGGVTAAASNQVAMKTFVYNGTAYPDSVSAIDTSSVVSPGDVADTQQYYAGYSVQQINTTRICLSFVPSECVEAKGADPCVIDAVNALLAAEADAAAAQAGTGGTNVAAIVAPVVVGESRACCGGLGVA
ncbi:hypothetical protein COO60DRAFT_308019 [Scenedesmus sp. NREL 46B-D3]|nr:hypothetical protein COO60DRAFT_308019 [Scenedesmus sp. NREL 46B-D3]